ncbi:MAG: DegV family protein [Bacillus sp. (in: Bacteria)]|nr:DegV family protein [Bacillus sp. (in: firmicutes)]MCM1426443.1 DegV family protein [Eubacterium sp.]
MAQYCLSCSSTADLSKEYFEKRDIHYICFHFELDGKEYLDDLGESVPPDTMYRMMSEGADTKTSQITINEYEEYFERMLQDGKDILHLCLSSGISGTYNSACIARETLSAKYPDRKIYVVDSLAASSGFGLLVDGIADMRDSGMGIDELYEWAENNKKKLQHWFFSTDLTFYIKGGRISKTSGFIGTVLSICPLLNVDFEGRLIPREKIRTKKKVIERIVEQMEQNARDGLQYSGRCFISQSACMEDARAVANLIESRFPNLDGKVQIYPIGATIGSHTGPGTVALFFWGKERIN